MIYVMSDIHGQTRRFDSVLEQISLTPEDTLYVLGDVIDRNPHGIQILRRIMAMPNVKMLLGNHEHMMLKSLYYAHNGTPSEQRQQQEEWLNRWYRNGGDVTHRYLKRIRKNVRAEVFAYLDTLPLNETVTVGDRTFLLVHAAPVKLFETVGPSTKYQDPTMFTLWHRFSGSETEPCPETVIFGHTGTYHFQDDNCPMKIWYGAGLIGIDCGAALPERIDPRNGYRGRLACLRLDDMKEFYSEEFE